MKNTVFKELFVSFTLRLWNSHETSDSMKANNIPLEEPFKKMKVRNNQILKN